MKDLFVFSRTYPDATMVYGDGFSIHEGDNNMLGHWDGSACPNGSKKEPSTGSILTYKEAYAWLALGIYPAKCIQHHKYGKSLLLAEGGKLPARYSNPNPNSTCKGTKFLAGVFVHSGFSVTCRGSAGCLTIHPQQWRQFIDHFTLGEAVTIRLISNIQSRGGIYVTE